MSFIVNSTTEWLGQTLSKGRYRIVSVLGEGGMGTVYLAQDQKLNQQVVVKMPHAFLLRDEAVYQRFLQEMRSLVELPHPHIVRIMDVGEVEQTPYLVMQYLQRGSLDALIAKLQQVGIRQRIESLNRWLPQIASALDYIHGKGMIHRDLKPANILFDESWNSFLSDFGIARRITEDASQKKGLTSTGMVLGTHGYMPLEMLLGKPIDARADQFALAVMVYESLAGKRPFAGETAAECALAMSSGIPVPLHEVDEAIPVTLSRAVQRGLSNGPDERFERCAGFSQAVLGTTGGSGVIVGVDAVAEVSLASSRDSDQSQQAIDTRQVSQTPTPMEAELPLEWRREKPRRILQLG